MTFIRRGLAVFVLCMCMCDVGCEILMQREDKNNNLSWPMLYNILYNILCYSHRVGIEVCYVRL